MNRIVPKTSDFLLTNPATVDINIDPNPNRKILPKDKTARPYWLYALRLENGKYYVGRTTKDNPYDRIMEHGTRLGARWTKKYRPIEVLEIRDTGIMSEKEVDGFEQNLTWAYMKLYGYKNVRGGNTTYSGRYLKIGNYFIPGNAVELGLVGIILLYLAFYIYIRH